MRSNDSLKVIVVGISKTVDDAALADMFSAFGSVAEAKVVLDASTKTSRGFGFVTFSAQSAMRRAVKEMDKKQVDGRTLNVRQLVAKDKLNPAANEKSNTSKRPCYLLRKGKCTKGDRCPYSHDTKEGDFGSCFEYVQNGFCKRGDQCKFYHPPKREEDDENEDHKDAEEEEEPEVPQPPAKKIKREDSKVAEGTTKKLETKNEAATKTTHAKDEGGKPKDDKVRYCFAFQSGRCHRGKRCLFLHKKLEVAERDAPPAPAATADKKKKPGEFDVVSTEEASKKRRRESISSESDSEDDAVVDQPTKSTSEETKIEKPVEMTTHVDKAGKVHTGPKPFCRHFLKGVCKRGQICFFRHERPEGEVPVPTKQEASEDEDEAGGPPALQSVADHMAAFMANFSARSPLKPFEPSVSMVADEKSTNDEQKEIEAPKTLKRKAEQPVKPLVADKEAAHPQKKPRAVKEKVDMGAAFDGADDSDDSENAGGPVRKAKPTGRHQKLTKEQMKANREKLRDERRGKRTLKKQARERLRTEGEIELPGA